MKRKSIRLWFSIILTSIVFSIFHIWRDRIPIIELIKAKIKIHYNRIKYIRQPIQFQMWMEREVMRFNQEMIEDCDRVLKVFKEPVDLSKVRK